MSNSPSKGTALMACTRGPALQARAAKAFEEGLQQRSDVERRLGEYVVQLAETVAIAG
jgi:hypothetical protein